MQFIFKFVILSLLALAVTNYIAYQKSGQIPALEWLGGVRHSLHQIVGDKTHSGSYSVKISKWTDANGVVHYENRSVDGAKTIEVDPDTNILPPVPVIKLPKSTDVKPKKMNEELQDIQEAKKAHFDALTQ